jgi:hypothetical protein
MKQSPSSLSKQNANKLDKLKSQISSVTFSNDLSLYTNLGSIVVLWNIFQHFYPNFDVTSVDWEKKLNQSLKEGYSSNSRKDFFITLSEMVAEIDDGHGVVFGEEMYHLPVRTEWIENNVVVTSTDCEQLKFGDIIKKINEDDAIDILKKTEDMLSGSQQLKRYRALNIYLVVPLHLRRQKFLLKEMAKSFLVLFKLKKTRKKIFFTIALIICSV